MALFNLTDKYSIWDFHIRFPSIWTPKYLTLSVRKSFLRLKFHFISPTNCFLLDLKITSLVFLTLTEILLHWASIPGGYVYGLQFTAQILGCGWWLTRIFICGYRFRKCMCVCSFHGEIFTVIWLKCDQFYIYG